MVDSREWRVSLWGFSMCGSHLPQVLCHHSARFALAAAVRGFSFHIYNLQVLIMDPLVAIRNVLGSLATMQTAGRVYPCHQLCGKLFTELNSATNNYCSLERSWITSQLEKYSLDKVWPCSHEAGDTFHSPHSLWTCIVKFNWNYKLQQPELAKVSCYSIFQNYSLWKSNPKGLQHYCMDMSLLF